MFNRVPKLAGLEFIKSYLNCIYYENLFCGNFAADDIHHLLRGYVYDYEEHVLNIYEPVLLAALGCVIAKTDIHRLDLTESGAARLYRQLAGMRKSEITMLIQNAATELTRLFPCPRGLVQYIQNSLPLIISRIGIAAQGQILDRVFVLPAFPAQNLHDIISRYEDQL